MRSPAPRAVLPCALLALALAACGGGGGSGDESPRDPGADVLADAPGDAPADAPQPDAPGELAPPLDGSEEDALFPHDLPADAPPADAPDVPRPAGKAPAAYGVEEDLGEPTDPEGQPLPQFFNPLGRTTSWLYPRREVFAAGGDWNGKPDRGRAFLAQDGKGVFAGLWQVPEAENAWTTHVPFVTAACDVDGDGRQEVVVARFLRQEGGTPDAVPGEVSFSVLDTDDAGGYAMGAWTPVAGPFTMSERPLGFQRHDAYQMDLACLDLDADGADEMALQVGDTLARLDDRGHQHRALLEPTLIEAGGDGSFFTRIAGGDLDGDGREDLVAFRGRNGAAISTWYLFDGTRKQAFASGTVSNTTRTMSFGNVAVGDVDGDGRPNVLFVGHDTQGDATVQWLLMSAWDGQKLAFSSLEHRLDLAGVPTVPSSPVIVPLATFHPKDRALEPAASILLAGRVVQLDTADAKFKVRFDQSPWVLKDDRAAVGDVMGNHMEQAVLNTGSALEVWGIDTGNQWSLLTSLPFVTAPGDYSGLALPEIDGDSPCLKYTGKHGLRFADPEIVAVLVGPPYWSDFQEIMDGCDVCGTSFVTSTTVGTDEAHAFSFEAAFSIGASMEAPLLGKTAFSSEVKATLSAHFDYRMARSRSTQIQHGYACPGGKEEVLFACVPFEVYDYEILASPEPAAVGRHYPLGMPREPQLIGMERTRFNEVNAPGEQVGADVIGPLVHGNPFSYPRRYEMQARINAAGGDYLWDPVGVTVGQIDGGVSWDTVTQEAGRAETIGGGIGVSTSCESTIGGVLLGSEYSFDYSYERTVTTSEGTTISGTIPDLPESLDAQGYAEHRYTYGVTAYSPNGRYFVVNYWVE